MNGRAWLTIAEDPAPTRDLYDGRLSALTVDTCVMHGLRDPRTEPGELDEIRAALPHVSLAVFEEGGHSPHSERIASAPTIRAARMFLAALPARKT